MLVPGGRVGGLDSRVSPGPKTYCSVDRSPRTSRMSWLQLWLASGPLDMCFSFGHGQQMILLLPCKPALQMGHRLCLPLVWCEFRGNCQDHLRIRSCWGPNLQDRVELAAFLSAEDGLG